MRVIWTTSVSQKLFALRGICARFAGNDAGATSIEYGLIIGLMALVCITAFGMVGGASGGAWGLTAGKVGTAMQSAK